MILLSKEDILLLHEQLIEQYGGLSSVRNEKFRKIYEKIGT